MAQGSIANVPIETIGVYKPKVKNEKERAAALASYTKQMDGASSSAAVTSSTSSSKSGGAKSKKRAHEDKESTGGSCDGQEQQPRTVKKVKTVAP
jgi:hypothetical protein